MKNIIGTLNEKPLHAALKTFYAQQGDRLEVKVAGYVIDILRDESLIEIQTGNFSAIKSKVLDLISKYPLRVVYPIAQEKWILKLPEDGIGKPNKRKSPKRGRIIEIFNELVSFPDLITEPNFSLEVVMIQEEEVRRYVGKRKWRNRGWVTEERRLLRVLEQHIFQTPESFHALIPTELPPEFTSLDFAKASGESRRFAQKAVYCLRKMDIIRQVGKHNRSNLYILGKKNGH
jgi:hypothetical protein